VKAFNELYHHINRTGAGFIDYETFFYPLDAILEWNRMYGARGFLQYQCVLPKGATREGLPALLDRIASSHSGSFLAVLKLLGPSSGCSPLSFPREGYTLALDFPLSQGLPKLLEELDAIVAHCGGRIYLAKDARMPPKMLLSGYSDLPQFQKVCAAWNAPKKFQSLLSQRLGI